MTVWLGLKMALKLALPLAMAAAPLAAHAQGAPTQGDPQGFRACLAITADNERQLQCFRQWAASQATPPAPAAAATEAAPAPSSSPPPLPPARIVVSTAPRPCSDRRYTELTRFWELESGADCDNFNIRGYKPISLQWIASDGANTRPSSPSPGRTAAGTTAYREVETRLQLSVRTRVASGLLTGLVPPTGPDDRDSLWFGYTQQSYWQLFSGDISRPFRTTDHEPELIYVYPLRAPLPGGLTLRMAGVSLNHQSNGQSLPLSRSWNRVIAMAAAERGPFTLQGRFWWRLPESGVNDDNPDIASRLGRAELTGTWYATDLSSVALTLRHGITRHSTGSARLDWFRTLGNDPDSGLRLHLSLFHGYGDSLVDYNRRRTVFGMGLSLVDW